MSYLSLIKKGIKYPERIPGFAIRPIIKRFPYVFRKVMLTKNTYIHKFEHVPDPFKLITINPNTVSKLTNRHFGYKHHEYSGAILGGDWDKDVRPMETNTKVRSLVARFERDEDWIETDLFSELISCGKKHDEALDQLHRYDRLYNHMQDRYKTSFELPDANFMEEICVSIGRDGDIYCSNSGIHRLTIAQILDLPEIPVRVMVRHRQWQTSREKCARQLRETGSLSSNLKPYENHPDLQDIYLDQVKNVPG